MGSGLATFATGLQCQVTLPQVAIEDKVGIDFQKSILTRICDLYEEKPAKLMLQNNQSYFEGPKTASTKTICETPSDWLEAVSW